MSMIEHLLKEGKGTYGAAEGEIVPSNNYPDYKGMTVILQWIECTNSLTKEGKKAFAAKIAGISEDNFTF